MSSSNLQTTLSVADRDVLSVSGILDPSNLLTMRMHEMAMALREQLVQATLQERVSSNLPIVGTRQELRAEILGGAGLEDA